MAQNLIINNRVLIMMMALLKIRQAEAKAYQTSGQSYDDNPKLIFSGAVKVRQHTQLLTIIPQQAPLLI
ncbi:MAG: hypothetical protein LRY43_00235 [Gammaproteobacteria bacterium]|nr:hypothetical protein [Gammaproteobacteria bacterium]